MKQRKPMSRGTGFKRPTSRAQVQKEAQIIPEIIPAVARPAPRRAVLADCSGMATSVPKHPRAENAHLLRMARGKPCLIRSPICNYDAETTVACHGGGVENGKGVAYKVSDALTCWGCSACNHYTDAYAGATKAQKRAAFMSGHLAQVCEWRAIAGSAAADPKDIAAARWALAHLNATPIGQLEMP